MAQLHLFWLRFKAGLGSAAGWIAKTATITNLLALTWLAISVTIFGLVVQDVMRHVVTIEPISVPKALADSGYTSEVASHRLRDALNQYANDNKAGSLLDALNISARDELPDFVVPQIGLSLDAIVPSIRRVLRYKNGQTITGEMIFRDNKYALRIRLDGREVFGSGFEADNPDELLSKAAPAITDTIQPYVNAVAAYRDHPEQGALKANDIIARREESDVNVQWAYLLKGTYFFERNEFAAAEQMFRKSISLNESNPAPHNELGRSLERQRKFDDAIAEFKRIIAMIPKSPIAYNNIGYAMFSRTEPKARHDDAIAQYRLAISVEPHYMTARMNLGQALSSQGDVGEAISEYHRAIEIEPKYIYSYWNLAFVLKGQGKFDEALGAFHAAIDCAKDKRQRAILHVSIGDTLKQKAGAGGNLDDAIAEYRQAVEIDPAYTWAHNNLGLIWRDQGKLDDAIAEFRTAAEADSKNLVAHRQLEQALKMKDAAAPKQASAKESQELKE